MAKKFLDDTGTQYIVTKIKDSKLGDFAYVSNVTVSSVTYKTYWKVKPTSSNQVYGIAIHPTNGQLYRVYNNKGTYSVSNYMQSNDSTAGTSEKASTKLFLAGATSQGSAQTTYSNAKVYIGTDNELYSNSKKVAKDEDVTALKIAKNNIFGTSDAWNESTSYAVGTYVVYDNALYKCITANSNTTPTNTTYWKKVTLTELSTNFIQTGTFGFNCVAGTNKIQRSTTLAAGSYPPELATNCVAMIINHSNYETTKDVLTIDGDSFIIFAEKAQKITVRWVCFRYI